MGKSLWRTVRWVVAAIPVLAVLAFVVWASTPLGPMDEALLALEPGSDVYVSADPWLVFRPAGLEPEAGLVLYPGGRVDHRAYAPTARAIAAQGYLVVVVPMPLNLAFFGAGRASDVIEAFPQVRHWAVGGHSLGGAFAAEYAGRNPGRVEGLALWAAYPAGSNDLSNRDLKVISIYGTRDGLTSDEEISASRQLLPTDSQWVAIEGGNHAQFGFYGSQPGDGEATIGREDQQAQVVSATTRILASLEGDVD